MQHFSVWKAKLGALFAGLLLLILAAVLGFSVRQQSQTIDEVDHIYAGYRYWQCGDFGVNPEHPPFAKFVDTLPLVFDRPKNPGAPCASYNTGTPADFSHGVEFLYSNDARRILAETRFFAGSFTILLALFVFVAARKMFGKGAALLALLLVVFEPAILAHGALIMTDVPVACCTLAAVYAFYRYTEHPTKLRMVLCGLATGLTLVAKHSGILLLPILAILALADFWIRVRASGDSEAPRREWKALLMRQVAAFSLIIVMAIGVLWAFYLFRYAARPAGHAMTDSLSAYIHDAVQNRGVHSILLTQVIPRLNHLLPESYLYGMANVTIVSATGRPISLLGHLYPTGRWFYFPVAFLIKSTLGFLLLLLLVLFARGDLWREKKRETLFLLVPALFFFGMAMTSRLNMGVRHILPVYPFLIVLAAGAAVILVRRKRAWPFAVAALVVFHCVSSLRTFPDYLSYSNEAWGGPHSTYRYLTNSDVDMGGGLIEEREYLERNHITDCWISYFGSADLDYYSIPCKSFVGHLALPQKRFAVVPRPVEGTLLISATYFPGVFMGTPELNVFSPLWQVKPVANLGGQTLVFQGRFDLPLLAAASQSRQAEMLAAQGRLEEALAEARAAIEMAPERMQGHLTLAQILAKAKQIPQARVEFQEALRLAEAGGADYYRMPVYNARRGLAGLDSVR
ncbi:MAG TPA: phospholipid carrier-dependent glycosyltransferase [Candidatus Sulfotelmatobacter sp.]